MTRDVVRVLLLVQAAAGLLASTGELLLMGNPVYAVLPIVRATALVVLAAMIVRGRRKAIIVTVVLQWLGLLGWWLGIVLALLPALAPSITLLSLLTELALPIAVIILCARLLAPPRHTSTYAGVGGPPTAAYVDVWRYEDAGVAR